jgi:hypothetical protein
VADPAKAEKDGAMAKREKHAKETAQAAEKARIRYAMVKVWAESPKSLEIKLRFQEYNKRMLNAQEVTKIEASFQREGGVGWIRYP